LTISETKLGRIGKQGECKGEKQVRPVGPGIYQVAERPWYWGKMPGTKFTNKKRVGFFFVEEKGNFL